MRPVTPVGGPASKNTIRPLSGLSGTEFSGHASERPEDTNPPKMGLDKVEMNLENLGLDMNP